MKLLLVDHYDSFTYNLHHYLAMITDSIDVVRMNEIAPGMANHYDGLILSPGPGLPCRSDATSRMIMDKDFNKPVLGICLGLQYLVTAFGGTLMNLGTVFHGISRTTTIIKPKDPVFNGISGSITTGHYHSWVAEPQTLPRDFEVTAKDEDGFIMAISHREKPMHGLQFHPESVLTPDGFTLLSNWVNWVSYLCKNR